MSSVKALARKYESKIMKAPISYPATKQKANKNFLQKPEEVIYIRREENTKYGFYIDGTNLDHLYDLHSFYIDDKNVDHLYLYDIGRLFQSDNPHNIINNLAEIIYKTDPEMLQKVKIIKITPDNESSISEFLKMQLAAKEKIILMAMDYYKKNDELFIIINHDVFRLIGFEETSLLFTIRAIITQAETNHLEHVNQYYKNRPDVGMSIENADLRQMREGGVGSRRKKKSRKSRKIKKRRKSRKNKRRTKRH